jgi:Zn-dependent protease
MGGFSFIGRKGLLAVMQIRGVWVYVHLSVLAIAAVMLVGAFERPGPTLVAIVSYFTVLLIHECGHMIAAQHYSLPVAAIELYPIHGVCRFADPWSAFDHYVIAWGGILAQAVVAVPILIGLRIFGFTHYDIINVPLAVLGGFSMFVAVPNLIPVPPLDGYLAWRLVPLLLKNSAKSRNRSARRTTDWR